MLILDRNFPSKILCLYERKVIICLKIYVLKFNFYNVYIAYNRIVAPKPIAPSEKSTVDKFSLLEIRWNLLSTENHRRGGN